MKYVVLFGSLFLFASCSTAKNLSTVQVQPEIKVESIQYDAQGNEIGVELASEIEYDTTVLITAKAQNIDDGEYINIIVYEKGYRHEDDLLMEQSVKVENGEARTRWTVKLSDKRLQELGEQDELTFVCAAEPGTEKIRTEIEIKAVFSFMFSISAPDGDVLDGLEGTYILESTNGSYKQIKTVQDDGIPCDKSIIMKFTHVLPGCNYILRYGSNYDGMLVFDKMPFFTLLQL